MKLHPTDFVKPLGHPEFKELQEWTSLSEQLQIAYRPTPPQYFATLDMRLLSTAIDYFIAFCVYAVMVAVFLAGVSDANAHIPTIVVGLLLVPVIKFVFSVAAEGSKRQASIGKILVGIKVTDQYGGGIGYRKAFLRNISKLVGVASLGIGFFVGFFDRKQRCWHDRLANTLVIKDRLI